MNKNQIKLIKNCLMGSFMLPVLISNTALASDREEQDFFCGKDNPIQAQSLKTIIPTLYSIVSGNAGSDKNWELLKKLHKKDAIITPVFHTETNHTAKMYSVEEFIDLNKQIFQNINFYESEISQQVIQYGHMATILSHYESRDKLGATPYAQGVNSFQLLNDGRRWCVISVTWDSTKGGHSIPTLINK